MMSNSSSAAAGPARRSGSTRRALAAAILVAGTLGGTQAWAQADAAYPERPIQFVVGFPPGGGVDTIARLIADQMQGVLGQPAVVENRPGASGSLAAQLVGAAAPDGYTVLANSNSMLLNQVLDPAGGYDIEAELRPVISVARQHNIIVAAPDLEVETLEDVFELARTRTLNMGTPGVGSIPHLAAEYAFRALADTQVQAVPFPGAAPALTAAMSGEIQLAATTMPPAVPMVLSDQVRGIAVTSTARADALPDVPTVGESGLGETDFMTWVAFFVPAQTPDGVVERLQDAILEIIGMEDIANRMTTLGFELDDTLGEEFAAQISAELELWQEVVAVTGVELQ